MAKLSCGNGFTAPAEGGRTKSGDRRGKDGPNLTLESEKGEREEERERRLINRLCSRQRERVSEREPLSTVPVKSCRGKYAAAATVNGSQRVYYTVN